VRRVAVIGADFAPSSLPPALRIRLVTRHLPEFGWEPIVVTTRPSFYECDVDPENLRLLPEGLRVIRTRAWPASLTRPFGIGDVGIRSLWHHWRVLSDLCRRRIVDAVWIPVPPYVPMVLGRLARARYGVPYAIDFIDPWVSDHYWKLPPEDRPPKWALAHGVSKLLEPFALYKAGHITGVSRGTVDGVVRRYPWLAGRPTTELPYGAEPLDLDYVRNHPRPNTLFDPRDGNVHLTSVGRGGSDLRGPIRALFRAVRAGWARSPGLFERLRFHFVGTSYATRGSARREIERLAREEGVDDRVAEHPERVPYLDGLQLLLDSHALIALGSEQPHYTASKIFPYILAAKPLLALFHRESAVVSILESVGVSAVTFDATHPPESCAEEIRHRLERVIRGEETPIRKEGLESYTARLMAQRLAGALEGLARTSRCG
jgi:hypothetical protein